VTNDWQRVVREATVKFTHLDGSPKGLGVLVPGPFIITVCHLVSFQFWQPSTTAYPRRPFLTATTAYGVKLRAAMVFADVVTDVAVLTGEASEMVSEPFDIFAATTEPVALARLDIRESPGEAVRIYDRLGRWGSGKAMPAREPHFAFTSDISMDGGNSGAAIVNDSGQLLGVVQTGADKHPFMGTSAFLGRALPPWVLEALKASTKV
jgi:hypothetical protein